MKKENIGHVVQAVGPIIDVRFDDEHLPELLTALVIKLPNETTLTVEVAQHIGDDIVMSGLNPASVSVPSLWITRRGLYLSVASAL